MLEEVLPHEKAFDDFEVQQGFRRVGPKTLLLNVRGLYRANHPPLILLAIEDISGPAALDITREFVPDAILLDVGLPQMDGYEVARRLRAAPETAAVRLIALTGYGTEQDRLRAKAAGFDHHLVKPVEFERLQAVLESVSEP